MKLERDKFEKMKDEFFTLKDWDVKTGIPTEETLKKRGILPTAVKVEA